MSQKTRSALKTQADVIRTEASNKANTRARVATMLDDIIDSAVNVLDDAAVASEVVTVKVTVTSAQILALNTTPKTLVAAPGAGKIIRPLSFVYKFNFGTTPYSSGTLGATIAGNTQSTFSGHSSSTNNVDYRLAGTFGTTSDLSNAPLILSAASSNPTGGDGTLDVYVTYIVITL